MLMNYDKLDERERKNYQNLRGLINYSKKLTMQMAENIISDLKKAGSDNIDSLMNLMNGYKVKQVQTEKEIQKLS